MNYLYILPNLAQDDVPVGKDEKSNKFIEKFGKIKNFLSNQNHTLKLVQKEMNIDFDNFNQTYLVLDL